MKKILAAATFITAILTGCLKDTTINTNGLKSTSTNIEIIPYSSSPFTGAGLENFSNSAILASGTAPLTLFFVVNVAGTNGSALSKDVTLTLGYDDAARVAYNATSTDQYVAMPDSDYSFPVKTGTIKAGSYLDTFYVTFYPAKIDPTKNYMAAITLMDAQGNSISGNFKTVYFHTIGNPLAGTYVWDFTRYSSPTITTPDGNSFTGHSTILSPASPTLLEVKSGYYTGPRYEISFTNTGGVLGNLSVTLNADDISGWPAAGVTLVSGPFVDKADFVNKAFIFHYTTATRYVIDSYHK
jgi:hypothetical protein